MVKLKKGIASFLGLFYSFSSYHNLHNTDLEYAPSLSLLLQKAVTPPSPIETRPLCHGWLLHIPVPVCRSYRPLQPFSLALSASFLQQGRTMVATVDFKSGCIKTCCYGSVPFWSAASRDQPTHTRVNQLKVHVYTYMSTC